MRSASHSGTLRTTTAPEAAERSEAVVVIPLGATEQHGPHLPLTTDTDIASALCARLATARGDVIVAPEVAYGSSGEHQGFAGTLSIGAEATERLLVELGRSATETWAHVLFVCTHGGNAVPLRAAVDRLRYEGRDVRAWAPSWDGDAHAGHVETSIMLALAPRRVELALAIRGNTQPLVDLAAALARDGVAGVSATGVLGDATTATAAEGRRLLAQASAALDAYVATWPRR